jgi:hypothetical protein
MADRPDEDGDHLFRMIDSIWHKARQNWRDDLAGHFERVHWSPLVADSRRYLRALRECLETLDAAERDTEF